MKPPARKHSSIAARRANAPPDPGSLGARLRSLRKAQKLTLKALSARSGVALSTLSKMELGQVSVSYEKVGAVARALGVDVGQLFDGRAPDPAVAAPTVVHDDPATLTPYPADHYALRMLAAGYPGKRMLPVHGVIHAGIDGHQVDYVHHAGQEFVMVLAGRVRVQFETGEAIELKRQQSAYFDSSTGHVYLALGGRDAEVLVVMSEG